MSHSIVHVFWKVAKIAILRQHTLLIFADLSILATFLSVYISTSISFNAYLFVMWRIIYIFSWLFSVFEAMLWTIQNPGTMLRPMSSELFYFTVFPISCHLTEFSGEFILFLKFFTYSFFGAVIGLLNVHSWIQDSLDQCFIPINTEQFWWKLCNWFEIQ